VNSQINLSSKWLFNYFVVRLVPTVRVKGDEDLSVTWAGVLV